MLQKPSLRQLAELGSTHYYLTDIGLWLLSDRAMRILNAKSSGPDGKYRFYDLYSDFGCALGEHPSHRDGDLDGLSVAVIPLPKGEFYHFGTTRQLLSTTLRLQNLVASTRNCSRIVYRRVINSERYHIGGRDRDEAVPAYHSDI